MTAPTPPPKRPAFFRQVRLRTLFLVTAAAAVWVGYVVHQRDITRLQSEIQALRPLAHELRIDDPDKIAVVKLLERWYDENNWDLHLPGPVRVCVASREVDQNGFAPINKQANLPAGRHRLELRTERRPDKSQRVVVIADGAELFQFEEPADWDIGRGSSGGGDFSLSAQLPADKPLELFRRRFMVETSPGNASAPNGPANGLLLWLEPTAE